MPNYIKLAGFFLLFTSVASSSYYYFECLNPTDGVAHGIDNCEDGFCMLNQNTTHKFVFHFTPGRNVTMGTFMAKIYYVGTIQSSSLPLQSICPHVTPGCPLKANENYTLSYHHQIPRILEKDFGAIVIDLKDERNFSIVCAKYGMMVV